jgi:hypothetical protein
MGNTLLSLLSAAQYLEYLSQSKIKDFPSFLSLSINKASAYHVWALPAAGLVLPVLYNGQISFAVQHLTLARELLKENYFDTWITVEQDQDQDQIQAQMLAEIQGQELDQDTSDGY